MNKLCRNALASCLAATLAVGGGIAVPAASGASLEQDTERRRKNYPVFTVNATTKEDGYVFGTSLVSKDASERKKDLSV